MASLKATIKITRGHSVAWIISDGQIWRIFLKTVTDQNV